jgi:hypothetical protein
MGSPEAPEAPEMGGDMGSPEAPEMGNEDDFDMGEDDEQKGPSFKSIQRLTGKLSQRLRTIEKERNLESDDIKYVLNSILSALNLDSLEEDDKDDILSKFDGEGDEYDMGSDELDMGSESDLDISEPPSAEEPEGMMSEPKEEYTQVMDSIFGESKVEKLLESYFVIKPSENKILEEKRKKDFLKKQMQNVKVKKEIRNLSETVEQMSQSLNIFESGAKFIGKTNKENLVFVKEGKQFKVTPHGRIL